MKRTVLQNKLRVLHEKTDGESVCINVSVLIGSDHENEKILGIAHAIEHMLFEGTKNRTSFELTSEIENLGGDMNAYTTGDKTNYYIKIHKKHAEKAIEILGDMVCNPTFEEKTLEKEKGVILEEIQMIMDEPRHYQWVVFGQQLFSKPLSYPTYGTVKTVKALTPQVMKNFHKKHYIPSNIIVSITGECRNPANMVKKHFTFDAKKTLVRKDPKSSTVNKKKIHKEKKKNIKQQYLIIGYKTPSRLHPDSYVLDVIDALLAKGQSGKLFDEMRTKRGLTYDLGIYNRAHRYSGLFSFYSSASKEKIPVIEKIYFEEIEKLKKLPAKDLMHAKQYIEGSRALREEDSQYLAEKLSFFEECGDVKAYPNYIKQIKKVTQKDIIRVINKYLNEKYTKIMLI